MNFEVRLASQIAAWALRNAGLDTDGYQKLFFDVLDKRVAMPAAVLCPCFHSETPVTVRVTVASYQPRMFRSRVVGLKVAVDNEAIGKKIREKLFHYSVENRGLAVLKRERKALRERIDAALEPAGVTIKDVDRETVTLTRPAQEALMRLGEEIGSAGRLSVLWPFMKCAIPREDRAFVARWLLRRFAVETDPNGRGDIATILDHSEELAVPEIADEVIRLVKNPRYGWSRGVLCGCLARTKDHRAAEVIASVLDDDTVARPALETLGALRAGEHVDRIKEFIRHPTPEIRRAASRALKKLGYPVEKPPPPIHLVKNRASKPAGLEEWSSNLDLDKLDPMLERLAQCIDDGFGAKDIAEIAGVVDEMKVGQTRTFHFPITARGRDSGLWVMIFMGDFDSPDLYINAGPDVIRKFAATVELQG